MHQRAKCSTHNGIRDSIIHLLSAHRARFDNDVILKESLVRDHLCYKQPERQIRDPNDPSDKRGTHRADVMVTICGRKYLIDVAVVIPFSAPANPATSHRFRGWRVCGSQTAKQNKPLLHPLFPL